MADDGGQGRRPEGRGRVSFLASPALGYVLLGAFAVYFLVAGQELAMGQLAQIGPGFFPATLAVILLAMSVVGVAIEWRKARSAGSSTPIRLDWRPLIFISLSIFVFAMLVRRIGLIPASVASAAVASLSRSPMRPGSIAMIAAGVGVLVWAVFVAGLNLSVVPFRMPF